MNFSSFADEEQSLIATWGHCYMRVIIGASIRMSGSILVWFFALGIVNAVAQSSGSRLHRLDELSKAVQQGSVSPSALAETVLTGARNPDLAAAISLQEQL